MDMCPPTNKMTSLSTILDPSNKNNFHAKLMIFPPPPGNFTLKTAPGKTLPSTPSFQFGCLGN